MYSHSNRVSNGLKYNHCLLFPSYSGLLADKLGSYVIPFQVAGAITIAGAFIPFMRLCSSGGKKCCVATKIAPA